MVLQISVLIFNASSPIRKVPDPQISSVVFCWSIFPKFMGHRLCVFFHMAVPVSVTGLSGQAGERVRGGVHE